MTEYERDFLIENYAKLGRTPCAEHLKKSIHTIGKYAQELNLKVSKETWAELSRIKGLKKKPYPKELMKVDPDKFFKITSPDVAYFLGLIWADGWINIDKITISILESDGEELLECFSKIGDIAHYRRKRKHYQPQMHFQINNRVICEYLISLGYKNKSLESACLVLDKIPKNLHKYWFRGLYDGDGYLFFNERGASRLTITGPINQCWKHLEEKFKEINCNFKIYKDSYLNKKGILNSRSVFVCSGRRSVKKFMEYVYEDRENDGIGLSRKFKIWKNMKEFLIQRELDGKTKYKLFTI